MAFNNSSNCGCGGRVTSRVVRNMPTGCFDVCVNPICGDPSMLSIMAPLIYDEIGINLCATFPLDTDISTTYPTAAKANVQVIDVAYTYGEGNVEIESILGRPNCYDVTLSNLTVTFALSIYDSDCRLLDTIFPTAVYLPPETTAPTYNEDTNPASVALEIFAPYGLSFNTPADEANAVVPNAALNYIGFTPDNNMVRQGLNLFTLPKLINFDTTDDTATVGLTLILQSLYYAGYNVASAGRIQTPKGDILDPDNTDCMDFVEGDLLNLEIKPLELGPPACEENLKNDCNEDQGCGTCPDNNNNNGGNGCGNNDNNNGNGCGCGNNNNTNGNGCGNNNNGNNRNFFA